MVVNIGLHLVTPVIISHNSHVIIKIIKEKIFRVFHHILSHLNQPPP